MHETIHRPEWVLMIYDVFQGDVTILTVIVVFSTQST
jgi:hypothetical protein